MSAPFESGSANQNNSSAVFESASGSPAVASSLGASPLSNSGEYNTAAVPPPQSAMPPPPVSARMQNSMPGENSAPLENSANAANSENAANAANSENAANAANSENAANSIPPVNLPMASTTSMTPASYAPPPASYAAPPASYAAQPVRPEGRSDKQRNADTRAKEFRARVNPEYLEMFKNLPPASRPKGFPATAARQAIQMDPEEQNAFVRNIASERRNAIEVKLGRKTRRVNPSTLKDIESILRMSEQSLIEKQPRSKALIRLFGRETRKIARNYTSEDINTLVPSLPTRRNRNAYNKNNASRRATNRSANSLLGPFPPKANKNNVINRFENTPRGSIRRNVSPPAYNE